VAGRAYLAVVVGAVATASLAPVAILPLTSLPTPASERARTPESSRPGSLAQPAPARWDAPAAASVALLRRITAQEARRTQSSLIACERLAEAAASPARSRGYRLCALPAIARTGASNNTNSRMLFGLASDSSPNAACGARMRALAGSARSLGSAARDTLLRWVGAPWPELLGSSRSLRGLAREALRVADAPGWHGACKALPRVPTRSPLSA